ncbi:MAG: hypothetical protein SGJ13_17435 [Actinomycetota bacterium]|nr:hypothetical protein [Actinomycetota bacterium]
MTPNLNVLVIESERHAADETIGRLTKAGHSVTRCFEPGRPAFPCAALQADATCPLDAAPVDVVLDVRPRPRSQPAPGEVGIGCAIRQHVPLVVAGSDVLNPFEPFAAEFVDRAGDVVGACERVARAPLPAHTEAAHAAMRDVLIRHDLDPWAASVAVTREQGRLVVTATNRTDLSRSVLGMAGVRMVAAIREIDHHSAGIDVRFVKE